MHPARVRQHCYSGSGSAGTGISGRKKAAEFVILWINLRELLSLSEKNIFPKINSKIYKFSGFFPARYSGTGTAQTGIEILGSCSAHPLVINGDDNEMMINDDD